MRFDSEGKLISKTPKSEVREKIRENLIEYNRGIKVRNMMHKISRALAVITIDSPDELKQIQSKITTNLQKEIDEKIPDLKKDIKSGYIIVEREKIGKTIRNIAEVLDSVNN